MTYIVIFLKIERRHMSEEENNQMNSNKMGAGIAIGLVMGVAFGAIMDNMGVGIGIGMAIGVAFGAGWSQA